MKQLYHTMIVLAWWLGWAHAAHANPLSCAPAVGALQYRLVDEGDTDVRPPTDDKPWQNFQGHSLDLNFTQKTLWVKFAWLSVATQDEKCILAVDYPFLDYLTLFERKNESWTSQQTGDRVRFSDAISYARHPAFVYLSHPGPNVIYLRVKTAGLLRLPLEHHDYESGHQSFVIKSIISASLLGALCLIILYSLSLFLASREMSIFFYAIFQSCVLYKNACDLGFTRILFPEHWLTWLNNEFYVLDGNAAPLAGVIFSISFLELGKRSRRLYYFAIGTGALAVLGLLVLPFSYRLSALLAIVSILLCSTFLTLAGVVLMYKKFRPARYFTLGWLIMVLASVVWGLTNLGILPYSAFFEWGTAIGAVVEASFTSLALGDKMRYSLQGEKYKVKQLNESLTFLNLNLENEVEQKTQHIRSIMAHIKQGIFTIDKDYKIIQDYSLFLESLLERSALQDYSLIHALQSIDVSPAFVEKMQTTLFMIFDEPLLAFELNRAHLMDDMAVRGGKILEVDWYPMLNAEGRIEKMLVSMRDVTEIRRLTLASKSHDEKMMILSKILACNERIFEHFIQESEALLTDCLNLLMMPAVEILNSVPVLKINFHTFKGMSRSLNFESMTRAAHHLEQMLEGWSGTSHHLEEVQLQTQKLLSAVQNYAHLAQEHLGRSLDSSVLQLPAHVVHDWLQNWNEYEVQQKLAEISTESLHGIIQGLNRDMATLAPGLGKEVPDLIIEGTDERIDLRMASQVRHAFMHIIRNALDHGIESVTERIKHGKRPKGKIRFHIERVGSDIILQVGDDGRGLDLNKLKEKMGHNRSNMNLRPTNREIIASWIFVDGISTASQVSQISGRGVGMAAVKHFLEEIGGTVAVRLAEEQTRGCYRFTLVITLKHDGLDQALRNVSMF